MVKFYNWVGLSLLLILSCGNPINITGPKYSDVIVTKMTFYDQLIIKGSRFKDITAVALRDPSTGQIIKRFKVTRYDDHEILGEQLDYNKIPIPNLLDLLIDTAQGQSVIPVQFSINANSVYTGAIQNGAITPTKFKGVSQPPPGPDIVALNYDPVTENFFFAIPSSGGGGGGGGGITQIAFGEGIVGEGGVSSGTSVGVSVNVGETGSTGTTFIPYFSDLNELTIDSSTNSNTRLLFLDNTKKVSLNFDNNLFKIHDDSITLPSSIGDLLTVDLTGKVTAATSLFVGTQPVCLANGTGCPTGIQPITGVPPIIVTGPQISADTGTAPGQLVILDDGTSTPTGPGFLPGVDGSHLRNIVTKINALDGITVSNGGIGIVDIGLAPAGSTGSAQPWDPALDDISNIAYPPVDGEMIIGASGTYVGQSGATLRKSIGLEIGVDVQAFNQNLDQISNATPTAAGQFLLSSNPGQWSLANNPDCGSSGHLMAGDGTSFNCSDNLFTFKLKEIQFYETVAAGGSYVGFAAPLNVLSTTIWALPARDGLLGQVLTTDGNKGLYWGTGNGDVRGPNSATDNALARFDTATGKLIQNSTVILDDVGNLTGIVTINGTPAGNFVTGPISSVDGNLASYDLATGKVIKDSLIPSANVVTMAAPGTGIYVLQSALGFKTATESNILIANVPTMAVNATGTYQPILSAANNSKSFISASYSIPLGVCPNGEILKSNGTNFICGADSDTAPPVTSVFTRTGAVIAQAGDYTANLVTNVPTGGVLANTVQGAITELDAEKLALVGGDMTGTIKSTAQIVLQLEPTGASTSEIHFQELSANGAQFVGFKAPSSINTNAIWTLPDVIGTSGQVLTTVGSGVLQWTSVGTAGVGDVIGPASSTDNAIARFNSATGKIIKNSTVILDDSGNLTGVTSINGAISSDFVTLAATPTAANYVYLSNGANKTAKTTSYTFPTTCGPNQILKADGTGTIFSCVADTAGVISFNGRSGVVVPGNNDYTGSMVGITASGSIAATNTQAAINELDTEKLALAGGMMTGQLKTSTQDAILVGKAGANTGELRFEESSGTNYVGFKAPNSFLADVIWTLPGADGTSGQLLSTNGSGVLNWISAGGASGVGDVVGPGSSTSTNLASFNGTTGKLIQDSGISSSNVVTMGAGAIIGDVLISGGGKSAQDSNILGIDLVTASSNFSAVNRIVLSAGATKAVTQTAYTIPPTIGTATYILKSDGTNATWQPDLDTVYSVFGRTGAVVAVAGDYSAGQVNSTPTVNIVATNVQAAINELDTEKLALAGGTMTGQLITSIKDAILIGKAAGPISGELKFEEATGNQYVGFKSPPTIATNIMWTLPDVIGTNGQVLTTVGGGVLQWASVGTAGVGDVIGPASSSDNAIARFNLATGKIIKNSTVILDDSGNLTGVTSINGAISSEFVTLAATPTAANYVYLSNGADKTAKTTSYTFPTTCGPNQILKADGTGTIFSCVADTAGVISFNGRSGVVVPGNNDYTGSMVGITASGSIAATNTQAAINELDTEKLALAGGMMTGQLKTSTQDAILVGKAGANTGELRFEESAGTNYVGFKASNSFLADVIWTLPVADGASGTILTTNGAAQLSWTTITGGAGGIGDVMGPSSSTATNLASFSNATGKLIQDSGISSNNVVTMTGNALAAGNILISQGLNKVAIDSFVNIGPGNNVTNLGTLNNRTIANWVDGPGIAISTNLAAFNGTTGKLIADSGVPTANVVTSDNNFTSPNHLALSAGNNKKLIETNYTVPQGACPDGQVLEFAAGNVVCGIDSGGLGDVVGPSTATNNALVRFDSTTGKLIQNSVAVLDDFGALSGIVSINGKTSADLVTMPTPATGTGQVMLSSAAGKALTAAPYTFPAASGTTGQVLKLINATDATWQTIGGGDVSGPGPTTALNEVAVWVDSSGTKIKGVPLVYLNIVTNIASSTTPNHVAVFDSATGKSIADSGKLIGDLVTGPVGALVGNLASYSVANGKTIQDSGISTTNVVTMIATPTGANYVYLSNGADKTAKTSDFTIPSTVCPSGQVLKSNGTIYTCSLVGSGDVVGPATSVAGRPATYLDATGKNLANTVPYTIPTLTGFPGQVLTSDGFGATSWSTITPGTGDVVGPASSVVDQVALFSGATGKTIKASPYTLPIVNGSNGQALTTNGAGVASWSNVGNVAGAASSIAGNIPSFSDATGKALQDSNIPSANIVQMINPATFVGQLLMSNGPGKQAQPSPYKFPTDTLGTNGQVLTSNGVDVIWASAAGNVVGPGSSSINELAVFADGTGKLIKAVPLVYLNIVTNTATPTTPNHVAVFDSASGKSIADSGKLIGDLVTGPPGALVGNLASYSVANGKTIQDSLIPTANVVQNNGAATANAIARFDLATGKLIKNSLVTIDDSGNLTGVGTINGNSAANMVTMAATPTAANYVYLSNGADKTAKTSTYTFPPGPCLANQILKTDGSFNFQCVTDTSGVTMFNGRTGIVTPTTGDYTASMVTNTPFGAIAATTTQGALNELDTEKLALTGGTMTGTLTTANQSAILIGKAGGVSSELRFEEATGNQYVGFKSAPTIAANVMWTLPVADGASSTVLTTNGAAQLSWTSPSAAGFGDVTGPTSSTDNAIARFDLATGKLIQNSVVTISDGGDLSGVATFTSTGNFSVAGSGSFAGDLSARSYSNNSDRSLKKDIKPFTGASSIVDKLMPVTFRWKTSDEKQVIGLIAQDMEKVIPEVISKSNQKGNTIRSYDLGQVLILTLEALKETREELKETRNELKVLRDKVKDLEKSKL